MQLKLTLSLSLTRAKSATPDNAAEPPTILEFSGSQVEHAGHQPIGFQIPPSTPAFPDETADRRR